jgi:hypothetical protein
MAAADPDLLAGLKLAKTKKMFFAFIPKGGSDGKLIVSKVKIPLKKIQEAKKEISGGTPVTGKCMVTDGATIAFQTLKPTPPTMAAAVKKVAKRDTGLIIDPDFQVAGDAEAEEPETDTGAEESAPAAPAARAAAPAPDAGASAAAAAPDALNLAPWLKARDDAIKDLKALAGKVVATKHSSAPGVLKEINYIIGNLPAKPTPNDLDKIESFIRNDDTLAAAHDVPPTFHKMDIRKSLLDALEAMKQ